MQKRSIYKHTAVIGIDGMGNFNRLADTPNLDRIFENGAVSDSALSMNPTISAENWGAMLLGAAPIVHGLTNGLISRKEYKNDALPTIFSRIRKAMPEAYLASCCNWNPINHGIVEHTLGVDMHTADNDDLLEEKIIGCIEKKPAFLFVQLDDVDGAGHGSGYGTKGHLDKIGHIDAIVGRLYDAYEKAGILDDTLFIVIADHGGIRNGHGGYTDEEKYVFFGATGKFVPKGEIGRATTKDIAATVLYSLGIDLPEYNESGFTSQIPDGIFPEIPGQYRLPKATNFNATPKATPAFDAADGLSAYVNKDRLRLAMFFDDKLKDESSNCRLTQHGLVKYYTNGLFGSHGELGKTGWVTVDSLSFGEKSFSIGLWLKIDRTLDEPPAVFGNKEWHWQRGNGKGFILRLRGSDTVFNIGNGEESEDIVNPFPEGYEGEWIHFLLVADRKSREFRFYYNFSFLRKIEIEEKFLIDLNALPFTVGNDALGTRNNEIYNLIFKTDDLLVFDGTLSDEEISKLAEYYGL